MSNPTNTDELAKILSDFMVGNTGVAVTNMEAANNAIAVLLAWRDKAVAQARQAAFDRVFAMAPKKSFEHWNKMDIAHWFTQLGELERSLTDDREGK